MARFKKHIPPETGANLLKRYMRENRIQSYDGKITEIISDVAEEHGLSKALLRDAYMSVFKGLDRALREKDYPLVRVTGLFTMRPKYIKIYRQMFEMRCKQLQGVIPDEKVDEYKAEFMPTVLRFGNENRRNIYAAICERIRKHKTFEAIFDEEIRVLVREGKISGYNQWLPDLEE